MDELRIQATKAPPTIARTSARKRMRYSSTSSRLETQLNASRAASAFSSTFFLTGSGFITPETLPLPEKLQGHLGRLGPGEDEDEDEEEEL